MPDAPSPPGDHTLLADQIAYYRARAGEYDEWWFRGGRFDRGDELNAAWRADTATVEAAIDSHLRATQPRRVLELACGTGLFTRRLAAIAPRVVAVDASEETIAINRARCAGAAPAGVVEYVQDDIFSWRTDERFDLVFFSFWLSHVPHARFAAFWDGVRAQLAPGGVAYLIDSAFDRTSTARDHALPDRAAGIVTRRLNDGREFRIVKHFYRSDELADKVSALGWDAAFAQTARYFIHGTARPSR